jgi:hypothetical protein
LHTLLATQSRRRSVPKDLRERAAATRRHLVLLLLVGLAPACGGRERVLGNARKGRDSAVGTARMTVEAWARGDVPERFARLAFEAARTRVEKDRQRLSKRPSDAADEEVASQVAELEGLSLRLARLADAADRGDVARAQELVRDLPEPRAP